MDVCRKSAFGPVDRPGWSVELVNNLLESETSACPVWNDRGGHPLMMVGDDVNAVYLAERDAPSPLWFNESLSC